MTTAREARSEDQRWSRWKQRLLEGGLVVAFWVSIFMLTAGERAIDPHGKQGGLAPGMLAHTALECTLWLLLTPGIFWLTRRHSLERGAWLRRIPMYIAVALGAALVVESLSHMLFPVLPRPFSFSRSLLGLGFLEELIVCLVVLTAGFARDYFFRYQERQQETAALRAQTAELQTQLAEARLEALRMQINPHFLFNTLHAVSSFIDDDPRGAQRILARLSKLLRYALDNSDVQEVPLSEEIKFLGDYLEIQRIRFQGRLETDVHVPPELHEALVPSLILQPLVENAIKHGAGKVDGVGRIAVGARREGKHLILSVRDNGPGLETFPENGEAREGIGLRNTRGRLANLYGDDARLSLQPTEDRGLHIAVTLPYHTSKDLITTAFVPEE